MTPLVDVSILEHLRQRLLKPQPPTANPYRRRPSRHPLATSLLVLATVLSLGLTALQPATVARADDRFGLPFQDVVVADATLYSQPDPSSRAVGPVAKGTKVPIVKKVQGAAAADGGTTWYGTPNGYLPASAVADYREPWVAEVTQPSIDVYAKPDQQSAIRRTASRGDLLRVTGVSGGVDGDTHVWWATTEGYVALDTIQESNSPDAKQWTMPAPGDAPNGWWGEVSVDGANVRAAPNTHAAIVGSLPAGSRVKVLSEEQGESVSGTATWYRIDGGRFAGGRIHSSLVRKIAKPQANTTRPESVPAGGTWIVVDRKASTLTLMENSQPVFVTYVSLGKAGVDTPAGLYSTFGKFEYDRMTSRSVSDATHSYDLPNVPYTQYYKDGGFAIHGTYWHDEFGTVQSQGCVNVTVTDGAYLFGQTKPTVAPGQNEAWDQNGTATPVLILG